MKYYLAYGSNLNIAQMKYRCRNAVKVGVSVLHDFELQFWKYLTVVPSPGNDVPLGVWLIDEVAEGRLDSYEGYPHTYRKEEIEFDLNGKKEKGIIYITNEGVRSITPPNDDYFETCLQGYRDFGFDEKYLYEALEASKR